MPYLPRLLFLKARRYNQSILKEISLWCSLEWLILKLKLQYFGHLMWRTDSFEKTLMLEILKVGEGDDRGWDGWMASSMSLSKLWELVMDKEARPAAVHGVSKTWTRLSDWTELNWGLCFIVCLCLKLFMDVWLQLYVKGLKVISHPQKKKKAKKTEIKTFLNTNHCTEVTKASYYPQTGEASWFRESQLIAAYLEQKPGQLVVSRRREITGGLVHISCVVRNSGGESSVGTPTVSSVLPLGGL